MSLFVRRFKPRLLHTAQRLAPLDDDERNPSQLSKNFHHAMFFFHRLTHTVPHIRKRSPWTWLLFNELCWILMAAATRWPDRRIGDGDRRRRRRRRKFKRRISHFAHFSVRICIFGICPGLYSRRKTLSHVGPIGCCCCRLSMLPVCGINYTLDRKFC